MTERWRARLIKVSRDDRGGEAMEWALAIGLVCLAAIANLVLRWRLPGDGR